MSIQEGWVAMAELKKRFGPNVEVRTAFKLMDQAMTGVVMERELLKNFITALAFDSGRLRALAKQLIVAIAEETSIGNLSVLEPASRLGHFLQLDVVEMVEQEVPRITQAAPKLIL